MPTMHFPRVMQRGVFAGRQFQSHREYQAALKEVRAEQASRGAGPLVVGADNHFELRLTAGSLAMTVTGDPRKASDVDRLLEALAAFGSQT